MKILINIADNSRRLLFLHGSTETVGRADNSTIQLRDVMASRIHAQLIDVPDTNDVLLTDLRSSNGTYVDGKRVQGPVAVHHGSEVRFGGVTATYRYLVESQSREDYTLSLD